MAQLLARMTRIWWLACHKVWVQTTSKALGDKPTMMYCPYYSVLVGPRNEFKFN